MIDVEKPSQIPTRLTLTDMQQEVDAHISQFEEGYWPPLAMLARVTEEVGELAREINHTFGPKKKRSDERNTELGLEIADIFFILTCLANSQGIDLEQNWRAMMTKYQVRDANRWAKRDSAAKNPGADTASEI